MQINQYSPLGVSAKDDKLDLRKISSTENRTYEQKK